MNRYTSTERIGVNETERIVIKSLGWVFREQLLVDVGIDAIIEIVKNGEPTGKLIAVQIKSGSGNFYRTEKNLSYYVSNIHYNYWLNLCIPIILVAHIPEDEKTYWQEITKNNLKKNKKKWKIEIPFKQEFNEKSENRLLRIASDKNDEKFDIYRGRVESNDIDDITEDLNSINDATICIRNITDIMNSQTQKITDKTKEFRQLSIEKPIDFTHKLSNIYKSLSKTMNLTAKRTETETELFSQLYSVGMSAFEKFLIYLNTLNLSFNDFVDSNNLNNVTHQMDFALEKIIYFRKVVKDIPAYNSIVFKEAKNQYIEILDSLISEIQDASEMTKRIFEKIN